MAEILIAAIDKCYITLFIWNNFKISLERLIEKPIIINLRDLYIKIKIHDTFSALVLFKKKEKSSIKTFILKILKKFKIFIKFYLVK